MASSEVHLLDVGRSQYGDCILCRINDQWVLIDGGHKADIKGSISHTALPTQIRQTMGLADGDDIHIDLLIVSHTHADHIGCLPEMVAGPLKARWALLTAPDLAWPEVQAADSINNEGARAYAIMREEYHHYPDELSFDSAVADASSLQRRYREMIQKLRKDGTNVVLHGQDELDALEQEFSAIGMSVLGPSKEAMAACAHYLEGTGRDFLTTADAVIVDDITVRWLYDHMMDAWRQNEQPDGLFGPVVNMQSSVVVFDDGDHSFLFMGDSQLEKPGVPGPTVRNDVAAIRAKLAALGQQKPFNFVKAGHHGSHNAIGPNVLTDLGKNTVTFGLCTGSESRHHPSEQFLKALVQHSPNLVLGRTDVNGKVTFLFQDGQLDSQVERGALNDVSKPHAAEDPPPQAVAPMAMAIPVAGPPKQTQMSSSSPLTFAVPSADPGPIEIRIPYNPAVGLDVSIQIKVQPAAIQPAVSTRPDFELAAGRRLPTLLFLTNVQLLAKNVGLHCVEQILGDIASRGHTVVDVANDLLASAEQIVAKVRTTLNADRNLNGVVIIGGYDVVPAVKIDTLPPGHTDKDRAYDREGFIVWTDNPYGDVDNDGLPERPVSRVPDGKSASLLMQALSAPAPPRAAGEKRHGIYNVVRPFAKHIFDLVPGAGAVHASFPYSVQNRTPSSGDYLYFMLHGSHSDASSFWGEEADAQLLEALHINDLQLNRGAVIFTGCCFGALPVLETAKLHGGGPLTPRTASDSIALACLNQGALAFVGCTGIHYSPTTPPYDVGGAGIHRNFWNFVNEGHSPSTALLEAKKAMGDQLGAHTRSKKLQLLDLKHIHQFCLLGLGW